MRSSDVVLAEGRAIVKSALHEEEEAKESKEKVQGKVRMQW
jgi:hypothetical protein